MGMDSNSIASALLISSGLVTVLPFGLICSGIGLLYGIYCKDESGSVYWIGYDQPVSPTTILENSIAGLGAIGWTVLMGPLAVLPASALLISTIVGALTYPFERIFKYIKR